MTDGTTEQPSGEPAAVPAPVGSQEAPTSRAEILYPDDVPGAEKAKAEGTEQAQEAKPDTPAVAEYQLKMPDGVQLDQELLGEATPVLREIGLTNEQANKLVPLVGRVQERLFQQQHDEFGAMKADWAKQVKADPNIGGKNWPETERLCAIAMNAGGAPKGSEFRELLDESGLGNHPAVIRLFRSLGHQLAAKGKGGGRQRSRTEILYPND
jgi:hypothetical protein